MRQSNTAILESQDLLKSDGCWRLIVFGGNLSENPQLSRVNTLGEKLAAPCGLLSRYPPIIKVLLFHSAPKVSHSELSNCHPTFFLLDKLGYDYERIYSNIPAEMIGNKLEGKLGDIDGLYGIDSAKGCIVVTRPDQYTGYIGALDNVESLNIYFGGFS